jgi:hypothetical protein
MNCRPIISTTLFLFLAQMHWCSGQAPVQAPKHGKAQVSQQGAALTLLSWQSERGSWYFILRSEEEFDANAKQDVKHRLSGVAALKNELARLPAGTGVFWSNSRAYGYKYPPDSMAEEIRMFAKRRGINLQYNPALE